MADANLVAATERYLQSSRQIFSRADLSKKQKNLIETQLKLIDQRVHDANLYLAVVGEFNAGKSTLINAFLRDPLLKSMTIEPTTAAATYLQSATALHVHLRLQNNPSKEVHFDALSKKGKVPGMTDVNFNDLRSFIHLITSHDPAAKQIQDVRITHPAKFLAQNVTIIDTPGISAEGHSHHSEVTTSIVKEHADAALIISQGAQQFNNSLLEFLNAYLKPYLHRCVFVMTRMDQIALEDQEELVAKTRKRLEKNLGLKNPPLYICSPLSVLESLPNPISHEIDPKISTTWNTKFDEFEQVLMRYLRDGRQVVIEESTLRLLDGMLETMDKSLRERRHYHEEQKKQLDKAIIPDLESFTQDQKRRVEITLIEAESSAKSKATGKVKLAADNARSNVRAAIYNKSDFSSLQTAVSNRSIFSDVTSAQVTLQSDLTNITKTFDVTAEQVHTAFQLEFRTAYNRLQLLNQTFKMSTASFDTAIETGTVSNTLSQLNTKFDDAANGVAWGAAGAAAFAALMLLPGINVIAILGAGAIGLFGGRALAERRLEKHKEDLWSAANPEISTLFGEIESNVRRNISDHSDQTQRHLKTLIDEYSVHYSEAVSQIILRHNDNKARLKKIQNYYAQDLPILKKLRAEILERQNNLRKF